MGCSGSKQNGHERGGRPPNSPICLAPCNSFEDVVEQLEHIEKMQVSGRYHRKPVEFDHHYVLEDVVLGTGLNGHVRRATNKLHGHKAAVKAFDFVGVPPKKLAQLEHEVEVFLNVDHPHIARLLDVYQSDEHLDLVMELIECGELFDRVTEKKRFDQKDTAEVCWQMLLTLKYLHEKGVVHGDVKLENWMYSAKDNRHLKLIDFGFSKMQGEIMETASGTVAYIAPEVLNLQTCTQSDMWSLGVIVFCLLSGYMPFTGPEAEQLKNIAVAKYKMKRERWITLAPDSIDFVRNLLRVDPDRRMTAEQALAHPFIASKHFENTLAVDKSVMDALCEFGHQQKFRRCCLFIVSWSLSGEERKDVEEAFLAMDQKSHGKLSFKDLRAIMVDKFRIEESEVRMAFRALDVHSDHEIHYSDFLAAMVSTRIALNNDLLQDCFQKFDADGSGYITGDNLHKVLGDTFNGITTKNMLHDVETICPGRMAFHEFVCYMQGKQVTLHGHDMVPQISSADGSPRAAVAPAAGPDVGARSASKGSSAPIAPPKSSKLFPMGKLPMVGHHQI